MGTSASFARKALSCLAAALLAFTLVPAGAFAGQESTESAEPSGTEGSEGAFGSEAPASPQPLSNPSTEADNAASDGTSAEGETLAASLMGRPVSFVNADVLFDSEPVIGSFTVDGLTFAVVDESTVELVGVSGLEVAGSARAASEVEAEGSASEPAASIVALPESVAYSDVEYAVTSIGAYAFYLSGVTSVELPASVIDVDDRAFRSSDVASVTVAEGNPSYSSFDGVLYDADQSSLLLIPEGKQGAVLLPKETEVAEAGKFSHCSLVEAIFAEDGAAFASENGLLYDASLTTLLRVPAGATEIAIREGCTTIAAGAMEGCASLATINAPASVTSISPDILHAIPTVSLPAASLAEGATQLTTMVALSSAGDDVLEVRPSTITVMLDNTDGDLWSAMGFRVSSSDALADAVMPDAAMIYAGSQTLWSLYPNLGAWYRTDYGDIDGELIFQAQTSSPTDLAKTESLGLTSRVVYDGPNIYAYWNSSSRYYCRYYLVREGYDFIGWSSSYDEADIFCAADERIERTYSGGSFKVVALWAVSACDITFDVQGGEPLEVLAITYGESVVLPEPTRKGHRFLGWGDAADGGAEIFKAGVPLEAKDLITGPNRTLYAQWERTDYDLGFDTDSEPGDEDYPGIKKPDQTVTGGQITAGDKVEIEDPKRPGYVFQGWTIPNAEGTEAIDQDLVYQDESDGKWYVDASKLPDYANDEGRVELTARWTSIISVDVPSSVTFYADVVTQGNESREGAASSAFGQNKVASQSEVDLRIVGLESNAVETQGSTLGADSILKKATSATPSSSTQKLFSLYPTGKALTPDDLQDSDAVSAAKPADAVDFALDDILLEKSFAADKFTIPAGDTLNLGYRLNLSETGTELDYDKLSTLDEGQSASIANISYCFAAGGHVCGVATGSVTDSLYIEYEGRIYGLQDIKEAAECISEHGSASGCYWLYKALLDAQVTSGTAVGAGPYFQLKVDGVYLDLQLIGICQDTKSGGTGKAGLTFQMRDIYAVNNMRSAAAGGGAFNYNYMNPTHTNFGGWASTALRSTLQSVFWGYLPADVQAAIVPVDKFQQLPGGVTEAYLDKVTGETIWLPSEYEVFGTSFSGFNESESLTTVAGYVPFQYMAYQPGGTGNSNTCVLKKYNGGVSTWWLRSVNRSGNNGFCAVYEDRRHGNYAGGTNGAAPAFCL